MDLNLCLMSDCGNAVIDGPPSAVGTLNFPDAIINNEYYYNASHLIRNATGYGYNGTLPVGIIFSDGVFSGTPTVEESQPLSIYGTNSFGQGPNTNTDNLDVIFVPLSIVSIEVKQTKTPNVGKIIRRQSIYVEFDQVVAVTSSAGVTATVHGSEQATTVSGSGTNTLRFDLQRAIFRHAVTWAYDAALGNIVSEDNGVPLVDVASTPAVNNLPEFLVWDWNSSVPDANTDTTWDSDETRFDEET